MIVVFPSGLGFGWVFNRNGSLLAVTIVHFTAGFAALAFGLL